MSSPILPVDGPSDLPSPTPPAAGDVGAFIAELAVGQDTLVIEAARGGPPPEVLEEIGAAARIEEALRARGKQMRFSSTAPGGHTKVELDDREADAVRTLSVSEAVEIATGKSLR